MVLPDRIELSTPPLPIGCLGFGIREHVEPVKSPVEQVYADLRFDPSCLCGRRRSALPDDRTPEFGGRDQIAVDRAGAGSLQLGASDAADFKGKFRQAGAQDGYKKDS
jgi:hypothetical protein